MHTMWHCGNVHVAILCKQVAIYGFQSAKANIRQTSDSGESKIADRIEWCWNVLLSA